MFWTIQSFPRCTHHIFLSHSAEDRQTLVHPVYEELGRRGVAAWLDRHDYPYGRGSRAALRDSILRCRHTAFFVTGAMVRQARGWCVQELAWAELLQDNLVQPGGVLQNVMLPLYFVPHDHDGLPRSVWQAERDRGAFWPGRTRRVVWAADRIVQFLRTEERLAAEFRTHGTRDRAFREQLRPGSGMYDRITRFDPQPLPINR